MVSTTATILLLSTLAFAGGCFAELRVGFPKEGSSWAAGQMAEIRVYDDALNNGPPASQPAIFLAYGDNYNKQMIPISPSSYANGVFQVYVPDLVSGRDYAVAVENPNGGVNYGHEFSVAGAGSIVLPGQPGYTSSQDQAADDFEDAITSSHPPTRSAHGRAASATETEIETETDEATLVKIIPTPTTSSSSASSTLSSALSSITASTASTTSDASKTLKSQTSKAAKATQSPDDPESSATTHPVRLAGLSLGALVVAGAYLL
ncbi:hypothetical protein IWQ60_003292 [Tieghemiomyces parasiticus]|uniref:Uncharacterized protein n=1 Tax=Tieghemiomyces parasiticus TaxID=78921 RepID=A0A9W8E079_9FUNG|nr:hypothetical protein IWQ60_003292 [Tieghemiomyces parasiticus]